MGFIVKLLLTGLAVFASSYFLPGVKVDGFMAALIAAVVLAVLNAVVRPVLVLLTIPITFITLGLFLLVINALIILLASYLVPGFRVDGFISALIFSLILSVITTIIDFITGS